MSSQLQNLSSQFNSLLSDYKDTYNKYVDVLNTNDNSFTHTQDFQFVGNNNLNVLGNSSVSECESACSKNLSCAGGTFNNTSNNCTLGSGPGNMIPNNNSVAIVKKALYYSNSLKEMNTEMTTLNEQMIDVSKNTKQQLNHSETQSKEQNVIMVNNNNVLLDERVEIEQMVRQFQTLEAAYEDGNIIVTANYTNYIVLLFVVGVLILLFVRYALSTPQYGGGHKEINTYMIMPIVVGFLFFIIFNALRKND